MPSLCPRYDGIAQIHEVVKGPHGVVITAAADKQSHEERMLHIGFLHAIEKTVRVAPGNLETAVRLDAILKRPAFRVENLHDNLQVVARLEQGPGEDHLPHAARPMIPHVVQNLVDSGKVVLRGFPAVAVSGYLREDLSRDAYD